MKTFIEKTLFKLIISLAILIASLFVAYYYLSYLPKIQKQFSQLATSNNNPGLIKNASGRIITFNSPQDGYAALLNQLQAIMDGRNSDTTGLKSDSTLCDYSKVYAPVSGNPSWGQYCADLANQLNGILQPTNQVFKNVGLGGYEVSPDSTLKSLKSRIGDLANAIANNNGFNNR